MMLENQLPNLPDLLRKYTQEDMFASGLRVGLSIIGPAGVIAGEFLTQFVPTQRIDRLQDFVEKLGERLAGVEDQFKERLVTSPGFAALTEQASLSAVRTASAEHRWDLASLLKHGLNRPEADMLEEQTLLSLRDRLNDAQILILMSYGNFKRTLNDHELESFMSSHPGVFDVQPPTFSDSEEVEHRWAMYHHYENELFALNLLADLDRTNTGPERNCQIATLGRLLLQSIGRGRDAGAG